jgi:hypothetical protein
MSLAAALLVLIGVTRIVATYSVFTQTSDEPYHLACGMQWLDQGRYQYEHQHPPLARIAVAVGPYLAGLRFTGQAQMIEEGNRILYSGEHYFRNLALARMGVLPFFVIACALVWSWSKKLFGKATALASTLLFTTLPPILAHSGLATTDVAVAAFMFGSVYAFSLWMERPGWRESAFFGLSTALALLSKFSAVAFLPPCLVAILVLRWVAKPPSLDAFRKGAPRRIASLVLACLLAFVVIWAGYRFSFGRPASVAQPNRPHGMIDALVGNAALPAYEFFSELAGVEAHNSVGHGSSLFGEFRAKGWWYFFPAVLAVKTPVAFLLLCGAGYVYLARRFRKRLAWQCWTPGVLAPVILLICMPSTINLGVRHILVIYPMLSMVAGLGAASLLQTAGRRRVAQALSAGLLLWQTLSSALAHPDYLAYFNEFVRGDPERVLAESDLDWGQDLQRLSDKLKALGVKEVSLAYFGTADIARHGLPAVKPLTPYVPATGWVAVSAHILMIEAPFMQAQTMSTGSPLWWLESEKPVARAGKSINLYNVPAIRN